MSSESSGPPQKSVDTRLQGMWTDGGEAKFHFPHRKVLQATSSIILVGYIRLALLAVERPWATRVFQALGQLQNKW